MGLSIETQLSNDQGVAAAKDFSGAPSAAGAFLGAVRGAQPDAGPSAHAALALGFGFGLQVQQRGWLGPWPWWPAGQKN